MEFNEFPKIARLSRPIVVTEKIDGTNASIFIDCASGEFRAGSRSQWITPEKDNHGFARWAFAHRDELIAGLGDGHHFGEWWGAGIQRRYGLTEKRFSLFNVARWHAKGSEPFMTQPADPRREPTPSSEAPDCCHVVPVIYKGLFDTASIERCLDLLRTQGSYAAPGFLQPEGIVVFHVAGNLMFKKTLDNDGIPKSRIAAVETVGR